MTTSEGPIRIHHSKELETTIHWCPLKYDVLKFNPNVNKGIYKYKLLFCLNNFQLTFTCSNSQIETLGKVVKYVQR